MCVATVLLTASDAAKGATRVDRDNKTLPGGHTALSLYGAFLSVTGPGRGRCARNSHPGAIMPKRNKPGNQYRVRRKSLEALGFADYREYLASPLWAAIRQRVFKIRGKRCVGCRCAATQVHHKKYTLCVMSGEDLRQLVPMCGDCHKLIEWDGDRKVMPSGANARLNRIRKGKPPDGPRKVATPVSVADWPQPWDAGVVTREEFSAMLSRCRGSAVVTITDAIIESARTGRGGWTERQLRLLGVSWPPKAGWKKSVVGARIPGRVVADFLVGGTTGA